MIVNLLNYLLILLIFEPSKVKLYIKPLPENIKPIIGLFITSESIDPPEPNVATATLASTPAFHPSLFQNVFRLSEFINNII